MNTRNFVSFRIPEEYGRIACGRYVEKKHPTKIMIVWPSGLRRRLQAPVRKAVSSNPTAVIQDFLRDCFDWLRGMHLNLLAAGYVEVDRAVSGMTLVR